MQRLNGYKLKRLTSEKTIRILKDFFCRFRIPKLLCFKTSTMTRRLDFSFDKELYEYGTHKRSHGEGGVVRRNRDYSYLVMMEEGVLKRKHRDQSKIKNTEPVSCGDENVASLP
ncbi:hypothetical protein J6590_085646 [Homalodisca vitripennis]|nr:hypothetical protein J6590_085646 [Homalodisca vitripennis]